MLPTISHYFTTLFVQNKFVSTVNNLKNVCLYNTLFVNPRLFNDNTISQKSPRTSEASNKNNRNGKTYSLF